MAGWQASLARAGADCHLTCLILLQSFGAPCLGLLHQTAAAVQGVARPVMIVDFCRLSAPRE